MKNNMTQHSIDIQQQVADLAPWFHNLHLPDGTQTSPDHSLGDFPSFKWQEIKKSLPDRFDGWHILDIGCNAGFYSFEFARRGARVTAIDANSHYLKQARWAAVRFGLENRIDFQRMQLYDLIDMPRTFDLVLFLGVFYHLRYPLLGLDIATRKVGKQFIFQTMTMPGQDVLQTPPDMEINDRSVFLENGWPKMAFIENRLAGDPTNWWAVNRAGIEAMLRSSGLKIVGRPGAETYICEPDPNVPSCITTWNSEEFLSATRRGTMNGHE